VLQVIVSNGGRDLTMIFHIKGTFHEEFDSRDFPFDSQGLTATLCFLNRDDGPFPIRLQCTDDTHQGIDFCIAAAAPTDPLVRR
jgi:hypothetical protein